MEYIYLIYHKLNKIEASILRLRFLDVETNAGLRRPVRAVCRILSCNVPGLADNLSDLTVVSFKYDILLCSETSGIRYTSLVGVAGSRIRSPSLAVQGKMPRARRMAAYVRDGYGEFRQPKFEYRCSEMLVFMFVV